MSNTPSSLAVGQEHARHEHQHGHTADHPGHDGGGDNGEGGGATAIDPVCGITVTPPTEAGSVEYQEATYHFCDNDCQQCSTRAA